jgi:nitrogenase molybdenum-iron protein beta chain
MQDVETIKPGFPLFNTDEYQEAFRPQTGVRGSASTEKLEEVFQWTTTEAYKELNFQREALTINPAKACQPLGAVLCALGFYKTCPTSTARRAASLTSALTSTVISANRSPPSPTR